MAWRVSWAALWATLSWDRPTMKIKAEPVNKQTKPAFTRVETPADAAEIVFVVMFTLRETHCLGSIAPSCSAGLLTQRVSVPRAFPTFASGISPKPTRFTVAGAVTARAPCGSSHSVFPLRLQAFFAMRSTELRHLAGKGI
jgi:hypothetical protein